MHSNTLQRTPTHSQHTPTHSNTQGADHSIQKTQTQPRPRLGKLARICSPPPPPPLPRTRICCRELERRRTLRRRGTRGAQGVLAILESCWSECLGRSSFRCVAACCSVLQCVAVCCSVLAILESCWSECLGRSSFRCVAVCCSVLQCVAVCCSV